MNIQVTLVTIYKNNLKNCEFIGIGIYHCYKNMVTRWKTCTCKHWPIYLANGQLPPQLGTTQISVKFSLYFGKKINGNTSQSRDKMLQILQRFVLYPAMMIANRQLLDRLANADKWNYSGKPCRCWTKVSSSSVEPKI